MLLKNQRNISSQRGMPIDDVGATSAIETIASETVQLYYWNSGVRTVDAGQAAGTVVEGVLGYDNIKNSAGTMEGNKIDTSLAFTAGALTTEVEIDETLLESLDDVSGADRAVALTNGLSNGQYVVDYTNGVIYGKKASTATTLTNTTYKVKVGQVGTSGSAVSSNVNLAKVAGNTTAVGAGNVSTGTQRVTLATDDVNAAAINASLDDIEAVLEDVHDNPANLLRTAEQDPLNYAFQPETVAAVTNGTDGTYTYYVDLATFRKGAIQLLLDGGSGSVTVTVEGSCQDDGTAPASCTYVDITNALFGSATFTASNILFDKEGYFAGLKYLKIKVVADTTGANDADWTISVNKVW
jgi:hypothetical protein